MLLPKDASSRLLPCSANSLHCEQPCAQIEWLVVTINIRKSSNLILMVCNLKEQFKGTKCSKQNKIP